MGDVEVANTETTHTEELYVGYPLLNPSDRLPVAKESVEKIPAAIESQTVSPTPSPVIPDSPRRMVPSIPNEEAVELQWWKKFVPKVSWFLKAKAPPSSDDAAPPDMWTKEDERDIVGAVPQQNPEFVETRLLKLLANKAPIATVIRHGDTPEKLKAQDVTLNDFYKNGYTLRDVYTIFNTFDSLVAFGLTKHYLFGEWSIASLSTLYEKPKREICLALEFLATDFVGAGITPQQMSEMEITAETLKSVLRVDFETLYAMAVDFDEFARLFKLTKDSLVALQLTEKQKRMLSAHRGWTPQAIARVCGLSFEELSSIWPSLKL